MILFSLAKGLTLLHVVSAGSLRCLQSGDISEAMWKASWRLAACPHRTTGSKVDGRNWIIRCWSSSRLIWLCSLDGDFRALMSSQRGHAFKAQISSALWYSIDQSKSHTPRFKGWSRLRIFMGGICGGSKICPHIPSNFSSKGWRAVGLPFESGLILVIACSFNS